MKTPVLFVAAVATLVLMPAPAPAQSRASGKTHIRQIFVSVTDTEGVPIKGLSAADFSVTEGGERRTVSHAGQANEPMRIALMLDTSEAAAPSVTHLRSGLVLFLDALPPDDEVMLVTTGRQVRVRTPPTTDREKLKALAAGLFADGGSTRLMDGLLEVDERFFRKAEGRWPVFVLFTSDGSETSAGAREGEFTKWTLVLGPRGITAHALVLKSFKARGVPEAIGIPEIVAENIAQNTGGVYEVMNTTTGLPDRMKALGETLARAHRNMSGWYAVDIQTAATDFKAVAVDVARDGVLLQVSERRRGQ